MLACWHARLLLLCWLACACAERRVTGGGGGGSLRGALEALQRRQRARADRPHSLLRYRAPEPHDYEELYELYGPPPPPQYDEEQYGIDVDALEEALPPKYVKYLEEQPTTNYNMKKKSHPEPETPSVHKAKQSAFRERASHNAGNDRLKEIFADRVVEEKDKDKAEAQLENDVEYAVLLDQLWTKYKTRHPNYVEAPSDGVVKLYKERTIKKRQYPDEMLPSSWGPVAFKKKRSPPDHDEEEDTESIPDDYPALEYPLRPDNRLKYSTDGDDESQSNFGPDAQSKSDKEEEQEYDIVFEPLEGDKTDLLSNGDDYSYDALVKRFPVTKRSSGPYEPVQKKRSADSEQHSEKKFRAGAGTDPKVMRDLSKIFGEQGEEHIKSPVKRSNKNEENSHETKPPQIAASPHNVSHDHNTTHIHGDGSHEHQGHTVLHPPNLSGKEEIVDEIVQTTEKDHPISLKKKSIDWSQYFGIDKRKKKAMPFRNEAENNYRNQYLQMFNHEMGFPTNSRLHNKVKRDFVINKPVDESEFEIDRASAIAIRSEEKRNVDQQDESKLDSIDRKLKGVESVIVDEALHMSSNVGSDMDSKEQQELKEKTLSRLAAAYSLEKMRKALKEFKQTLHTNRDGVKEASVKPIIGMEESKKKRIAIKKEKAELKHDDILSSKATETENTVNDEFEGEQGAGHYSNGGTDEPFSEGYMGGSGRHHAPTKYRGSTSSNCPVLERIVQRCRGIDLLAGDQGQLFLPLCSLHQICYLCGQSAPTTCDLIFLSEADTACEGHTACAQAARGSLMAMRELHESLVDDLDGECEASPCLASALRRNLNWSQAVKR